MKTKMHKFRIAIIITLANLLIVSSTFAQAPQKMSYQAVIRNTNNALVTSTPVGIRISVLQGSIFGASVYVETQTPNTNANGLVSLEIGTGTIVTGTFADIDWANGPYFVKTETDPTGGATYTITGTNELMSVPYALFSANGGVAGPQGLQGTAGNDGANGAAGSQGTIGNTGLAGADGRTVLSGIANPTAAVGVNGDFYFNTTTRTMFGPKASGAWPTGVSLVGATGAAGSTGPQGPTGGYPVHFIGESYGGGIVFYVYDGGQHGLIAATSDQNTNIFWSGSLSLIPARANGIGAGLKNTLLIIANVQGLPTSASWCNEYSVTVGGTTYGDWYLPSRYELNLLYLQKNVVGGFANDLYWSSSEINNFNAYHQDFSNGLQGTTQKDQSLLFTRAIRAF